MSRLLTMIKVLLGSLMLTAVGINLANIVGRYAFSRPIFWAEEGMVFIQVWCVVIGAVLVSYDDAHLRMDAFEHLAPLRIKRRFDYLTGAIMLVVAVAVTWASAGIVIGMLGSDQRSMAMDIPMAIPYAALPIGFSIIALVTALRLLHLARSRAGPPQDK